MPLHGVDDAVLKSAKDKLYPVVEEFRDNEFDPYACAVAMIEVAAQLMIAQHGALFAIQALANAINDLTITGPMFEDVLENGDPSDGGSETLKH